MPRKISSSKLIAVYGLLIVTAYLTFFFSQSFLSWFVLLLLALPFSIIVGLISVSLKRFRVECSGDGVSTMLKPSADICQRDFGVSTLQRVL